MLSYDIRLTQIRLDDWKKFGRVATAYILIIYISVHSPLTQEATKVIVIFLVLGM